jgi:outer membrane protein, heavy metal efflux system
MKVRSLYLSVLSFLVAMASYDALQADTLTLKEVVSRAVVSNGMSAASRLMEQSARENAESAGRYSDPMLMLGIENLPTSGDFDEDAMTMRSVGISWALPYSGELRLLRKAADRDADGASFMRQAEELSIARRAGRQFADVRYLQSELLLMQSQLEFTRLVLSTANGRHISNQGGEDEVIMAQNEVWRMEADIVSATRMVKEEWRMLAAMTSAEAATGESVPVLSNPHLDTIPATADSWLLQADSANPRLRQLEARAEASRITASASRRMNWPMLALGADYGFRSGYDVGLHGEEGKRGDMMSFRANLSLPFFSRKKNSQMASAMNSMAQAFEAERRQIRLELQAEIRSLHDRARQLIDQIRIYRERVIPSDRDLVRIGMRGYSAGRTALSSVIMYIESYTSDQLKQSELEKELTNTILSVCELTGTMSIDGPKTTGKQ